LLDVRAAAASADVNIVIVVVVVVAGVFGEKQAAYGAQILHRGRVVVVLDNKLADGRLVQRASVQRHVHAMKFGRAAPQPAHSWFKPGAAYSPGARECLVVKML
jgi:hypothetical protein